MRNRGIQERVWLLISLIAFICILPFTFIRLYYGDLAIALLDGVISAILLIIFTYTYRTRKIEFAKNIIAILLSIAALMSIVLKGHAQILWIHPTIIAIYYLIPIKLASIINIILITIMIIIVSPLTDLVDLITIIATTTLTTCLSFLMFHSYNKKQQELILLATLDPLTNTGNRRSLNSRLSKVIASQNRQQNPSCLILIDLDGFKAINDEHGHNAGDETLITVCKLIDEHTRVLDSLYRYGGDEFIILPLNMTLDSAKNLAEKIRYVAEKHDFNHDIKLTLSIGVSEFSLNDTPETWIKRSDKFLYKAKEGGRNRVY
jgi:diguanylate cyclase (GGDEF)-like protein